MLKSSPWGEIQVQDVVAEGITRVHTAGHGGFHLSAERHRALQRKFHFHTFAGGPWYEEDCDMAAVVIAFPDDFKPEWVARAVESAQTFMGWKERDYSGKDSNWHRVCKFAKYDTVIQGIVKSYGKKEAAVG